MDAHNATPVFSILSLKPKDVLVTFNYFSKEALGLMLSVNSAQAIISIHLFLP
jgi:hypothetical protein